MCMYVPCECICMDSTFKIPYINIKRQIDRHAHTHTFQPTKKKKQTNIRKNEKQTHHCISLCIRCFSYNIFISISISLRLLVQLIYPMLCLVFAWNLARNLLVYIYNSWFFILFFLRILFFVLRLFFLCSFFLLSAL